MSLPEGDTNTHQVLLMLSITSRSTGFAFAAALSLGAATVGAQSGLLPAGTVVLVRTTSAFDSRTAQTGQSFETTVDQNVSLDGYSVLPAGTKVGGTIALARAATRAQSGVIDLHFDKLVMSDGSIVPITGKLTSTDSAERRQINADPNAHVVLVGARGGIGAAIAGAGSSQNPNNILSALGAMLSEGRDVAVPAGTQIAVELERGVSLRRRGRIAANDPSAIYTSADRIQAAQRALTQRNYYRGAITGELDNTTRRALFAFQIDNKMTGTGNLDARTAQLLGVAVAATDNALTPDQATAVRQNAQTVLGNYRASIGINTSGRANSGRAYNANELEALFEIG